MKETMRDTGPATPLTFRAGTAEDFSECAELWMRALALRDGTPSDPEMKRKASAKLTAPGGILSIAESQSGTHGFALAVDEKPACAARTAHLALLAVDPAYQGRGLGRALLANMTQLLVTDGFAGVSLRVLEANMSARKIYEKAGWKIAGCGIFEDSGRPYIRYLLGLAQNDP